MPLCHSTAAAMGRPSSPSVSSAPRQLVKSSMAATTGGAAAKPRLPVKEWMAKDRPIRSFEIEPARIE